jgi:hypothetical protein
VWGCDLHRAWDNIFGNLHSCCILPDVMVPWHVVMGKAEYGHNAGNELRRVRHYLSAQEQKCDGNDCTACGQKFVINGGERVPVTMHQRWGKGAG